MAYSLRSPKAVPDARFLTRRLRNPPRRLKAIRPQLSAPRGPSVGLALLAEGLMADSAWNWLGALASTITEIVRTISPQEAHRDVAAPPAGACDRPSDPLPLLSNAQVRRAAEGYRVLADINKALAHDLAVIRDALAQVEAAVPAAPCSSFRQGLCRWQEKRARSYLLRNLASRVSNAELAAACGLSQNYFVTAFRQSTGETPHACLLRYRVAKAKELLQGPTAIAEIALACGFGDQSHLTRVFAKHTGLAPGEWRRERRYERVPDADHASTVATASNPGPRDKFATWE